MTKNDFILQAVLAKISNSNAQLLNVEDSISGIIKIATKLEREGIQFKDIHRCTEN